MSSINIFQIAMDMNGPPGLIHPLLREKWSWVDNKLEEMCLSLDDSLSILCLASVTQDNCRKKNELECLVEDNCLSISNRSRSVSDISDYNGLTSDVLNRLGCQSPLPTDRFVNYIFNNKNLGHYDEEYELNSDVISVIYDDIHYVTEDEDEEIIENSWGEEMESFIMYPEYDSDDESSVLGFCDSP